MSYLFPFYTGCLNPSYYGSKCKTPCPTNCEDSTCHIQSGACFTCKPGWSGVNCDTSKMTNKVLSLFTFPGFVCSFFVFFFT